jgi:steroid delta-isomerase-like uncharacterized protein
MTQDAVAVGREFFDAYNERQVERGTALTTEQTELVEVATDERYQGAEGYRQEYEKWANAFPDGRCEVRNTIAAGDWATLELTFRGTNTGAFAGAAGEIPATGREVTFDFCTVVQAREGKIVTVRHYHDNATIMQQLGLMPEAAAATA